MSEPQDQGASAQPTGLSRAEPQSAQGLGPSGFDPSRDENGVLHVVALSGGKDSTAMALQLAKAEPRPYVYVCTPTGNEPEAMFAHWRKLGDMLGRPILPIIADTLEGLIRKQKAIPNHRQRWCTRILKLEPYYGWLADRAREGPVVSYVGLRADEESRPGMIFPEANGVQMRFPMREWGWTLSEVLALLKMLGVEIPCRTDCEWCFWQTLAEWYLLWKENLASYMAAEACEKFVTEFRGREFTFRSPSRDSWPASLRDLRGEFERGRVPERSLTIRDNRRLIGPCRVCTL